jgi:drug/metabolite transporter (DMT)-like permease
MKKSTIASLALIAIAMSWGAAFVLMKDAIATQPFYDFLASRFTVAAIVMIAVRPSVLRSINRETLKHGSILGLLLGLGYFTQTLGLEMTTAAITGFITGLYVVLTPILGWLVVGQQINRQLLIGLALALAALVLISFNGFSVEVGQLWVMLCALLLASHIVGLSVWSPGKDVYALTTVQISVVALMSWVGAFADGEYQSSPNPSVTFAIIFTAVVSTSIAFLVQTWAQSMMDASRVAILLTSEVVWAATFAVLAGQEKLSTRTLIGGATMIAAMLIVEWPTKESKELKVVPRLID